ncbi:hypothetical protein HPB47_005736, partial [Ixodes persulcatus]
MDPLDKLQELTPAYAEQGVDVKLGRSQDGQTWAVLVVIPIMRRTQKLDAAKE